MADRWRKGALVVGGINYLSRLLDLVLPPTCLCCGVVVAELGAVCADCWKKIQFYAPPWCACCGQPFDIPTAAGSVCAVCLDDPPLWSGVRSVMLYDDASKPLVLKLKHGDRLDGVPSFARWMVRVGADILTPDTILVPVPLHYWRLVHRRYNQAALLARQVARLVGCGYSPDGLRRVRATASQGHLGRGQRQKNVSGAFAVHASLAKTIRGANLVLVDDVMTSGATMHECAKMLLQAGAGRIAVLTLARAVV